jgi:uridine kinase
MRPVIVGITGGTGSGKSTFCDLLLDALDGYKIGVIKTDKYFKKQLPKTIAPLTKNVYDDYNHPDSVDYETLIKDFHGIIDENSGNDIVIIEGLMVLYFEEIRERLDLKIFIDLDSDERMYRRIIRNMKTRGWSMEEIATYYIESVKYREKEFVLQTKIYADIILNGKNLKGKAQDIIASWIEKQMLNTSYTDEG